MKKILLLVFALVATLAAEAQNFSVNRVETNGTKVVSSELNKLYSKKKSSAAYYLNYTKTAYGDANWYFVLILNEDRPEIAHGRKLLFKTADNQIIELLSTRSFRDNCSTLPLVAYGITEEQIRQLKGMKIVKVRIETNNKNLDYSISAGRFAKEIGKSYSSICEVKDNTVYDNF